MVQQPSEHIYERYWVEQGHRIIDCLTCGFIHIDPIPTREALQQFYREKYYQSVKPFPYSKINEETVQKITERIVNDLTFSTIYDQVTRFNQTGITRMLDIGCGNNLLSKYFQLQGWNVCAVEPNKEAEAYLRKFGLNVLGCIAEDLVYTEDKEQFSFVNIQFVLEHIREPINLLNQFYKFLVPGGLIRVCVPNDFSEGQMAYQQYHNEKLRWVCLPDHINYFSFESLKGLLDKCGFREIYRTTNFPLEFLLAAGMNYYTNQEEQAKIRPFVTNFENSLLKTGREELLKQLYENLAQLGFGRSIFMYAIKE